MRQILSLSGGQWLRSLVAWSVFAAAIFALCDGDNGQVALAQESAPPVHASLAGMPPAPGSLVRQELTTLNLDELEPPAFGDLDEADDLPQ